LACSFVVVYVHVDRCEYTAILPVLAGLDAVVSNSLPSLRYPCYDQEPSILHTLRTRFSRDQIYTWVSSILISVNPCKPVDLYSNDRMRSVAAQYRQLAIASLSSDDLAATPMDLTVGLQPSASDGLLRSMSRKTPASTTAPVLDPSSDPHVFRVADEAYRALLRSGNDQSIVIRCAFAVVGVR
jgi:myosin heavy subunit